jgi:hydrogenase maturation protease
MMGDDGIGPHLIDQLEEYSRDKELQFGISDISQDVLKILFYIRPEVERLLLIDCALMNLEPGDYRIFSLAEALALQTPKSSFSAHSLQLQKVIDLATALGYPLPCIKIMAIEPYQVEQRPDISPVLKDRLHQYLEAISREIALQASLPSC